MAAKSGSPSPGRRAGAPKAPGAKRQVATADTANAPASKAPSASVAGTATGGVRIGSGVAVVDERDPIDLIETAGTEDGTQARPEQRKPWPVRLYLGEIGYDFIGKRKLWYIASTVLVLICVGSMIFNEFNLGVEFAGGERFRSPGAATQLDEVTQAVEDAGAVVTSSQAVGDNQLVLITADLDESQSSDVAVAIAAAVGVDAADVTNTTTSASWGRDVTSKALQGLLVFLVLVIVFLAIRFQWKMAVGAMVALFHDLVITAGIYSLVGLEVTPASVIGLLTILGFSLYDTVVVFDKVDDNAKGLVASQRRTYSESANLAINQVLMRSINTSIFALLPVLGLLYAGVFLIGEGTLQDLALVLFVGMLAGVYSSIFLAAPVLCDLKEREPEYQKLAKRLKAKRSGTAPLDKKTAGRSPSGPESAAPAAAAKADRRRKSPLTPTASATRREEPVDTETIDDEAINTDDGGNDDSADHPNGGGTLVASARRTRPRSHRSAPVSTKSEPVRTAATSSVAGPDSPEPAASSGASTSAGSRLAPRPGAKPSRAARTRGGSTKRKG